MNVCIASKLNCVHVIYVKIMFCTDSLKILSIYCKNLMLKNIFFFIVNA